MRPLDGTSPLTRLQQARQSGTIVQVDSAARAMAAQTAHSLLSENEYLFLNSEPESLMNILLWDPWPYAIPPSKIVIEICERTMNDAVRPVVQYLKGIGVQIAIDDFGTGMSNLWMLDSFSPDFIKLDQVFLHRRAQGQTLEAVVAMAQRLGTRLIVEGLETPEEALFLRKIQAVYAQGYYLGAPAFIDELAPWMEPSVELEHDCIQTLSRTPSSHRGLACGHRYC